MASQPGALVTCDYCGVDAPSPCSSPDSSRLCGNMDPEIRRQMGLPPLVPTRQRRQQCRQRSGATSPNRIRGPKDVPIRLGQARDTAARDGRLSDRDRAYLALCHEIGAEQRSVQIAIADEWAMHELGLTSRTQVRRVRQRLTRLGYLSELRPSEVTMYALRGWVETRRANRQRVPVLVGLERGPDEFPKCAYCGGDIPDIERVSRKYCSPAHRMAAFREEGGTPFDAGRTGTSIATGTV
jgi:hypothetical protein